MIHVSFNDANIRVGVIPPDYVNNAIITAGYETARRKVEGDGKSRVYTVVCSSRTEIHMGMIF